MERKGSLAQFVKRRIVCVRVAFRIIIMISKHEKGTSICIYAYGIYIWVLLSYIYIYVI